MILGVRTTGCMHTRQSSYEIVGDCIDKGVHQYQPLHRFILRQVLSRRRVTFMLRVMKRVVSYELFWNWIGVVRFQVVSHEVCCDKGFVIWYFLYFFLIQIVSLWSLSIWIRIIFKTNELVIQIRHWNQMPHGQDFWWKKMRCRQKFVVKIMRRRQKLIQKKWRRQDFFDRILMGTLSCWRSMLFVFHKSRVRIFFSWSIH
jgi:hypothetical protein